MSTVLRYARHIGADIGVVIGIGVGIGVVIGIGVACLCYVALYHRFIQ